MSKFRVGDKVYYVSKDGEFPVGTKVTITKTDGSNFWPYRVNAGDKVSWAAEDEVSDKNPRTPEVIRAEVAALEAELAAATTLKVGDMVTVKAVVTEVFSDGSFTVDGALSSEDLV